MNKGTPRYEHNCDRCQFLGQFDYDGKLDNENSCFVEADLYFCEKSIATIVVRYGNSDPAYTSMPISVFNATNIKNLSKVTDGSGLVEGYNRWLSTQKTS